MNKVPADFYNAVEDVFVLERAALRAKKGAQGYLTVDDILDEPMMRKVVGKYGRATSRRLLVDLASIPRKDPAKLLEFEPSSYLAYKTSVTPNNTSALKVRPWAHRVRQLQREMHNRYEISKRESEPRSALRATADEFVPASVREAANNERSNRVANAMFGPAPTLRNIRKFWNQGNTRRGGKRSGNKRSGTRKRRN